MQEAMTVKVSKRFQIALPSAARKLLKIEVGDRLLVDIQDGALVLVPQPDDYVDHLAGLHKDIWSNVASDDYLRRERDSWTPSNES